MSELNAIKIMRGEPYRAKDFGSGDQAIRLFISPAQLVYQVFEKNSNRIKFVQPYQYSGNSDLADTVKEILQQDAVLNSSSEVKIVVFTSLFTLVPENIYEENLKRMMLEFVSGTRQNHTLFTNFIGEGKIRLLYQLENGLLENLSESFSGKEISNATGSFLSDVMKKKDTGVYAQVLPEFLQVTVMKNGTLQLCNIFEYSSSEDFLFYLLTVYRQLGLSSEEVPLVLHGEIMQESNLYALLYKYIRNIRFINAVTQWKFEDDYPFPVHFYYNLFCV